MKTAKQRYCLVIDARADEKVGAEQRHALFFERIKSVPAPWGMGNQVVPRGPTFRDGDFDAIGFTKFFGGAVKQAMLTYVYRRTLDDSGDSDDRLFIDIDPAKSDLHQFAQVVIPRFIEAFDGYRAECFDEQFLFSANKVREGEIVARSPEPTEVDNLRFRVTEVMPISFFDELLCRRAFNRTPAEVLERMRGMVEHARLLHGGVYLIGSTRALSFDEAQALSDEMTRTLLG